MRNNLEDKFQNLKRESAEVAAPTESLSFVTPVEVVDLPSKGKLYGEGHPLQGKESVEIRQMTAKDEDVLTNKSYIKKGIVLDKFLESVLVDKNIKPESLLVGDKNAILISARISGYGERYDVTINCEECGSSTKKSIDLLKAEMLDIETLDAKNSEEATSGYTRLSDGNIVLQLPKTKWAVECKLLTGQDEKAIVAQIENKKRRDKDAEISTTDQLQFIIKSINGVEDKQVLSQAVENMPAADSKYVRNIYAKIVPNVKISCRFVCELCLTNQEVEVPFTQEFFWPR